MPKTPTHTTGGEDYDFALYYHAKVEEAQKVCQRLMQEGVPSGIIDDNGTQQTFHGTAYVVSCHQTQRRVGYMEAVVYVKRNGYHIIGQHGGIVGWAAL
jgi:hypothetical protein